MLRITVLSLLFGAAALVVLVTLVFGPQNASHQHVPALIWNPATAKVASSIPTVLDTGLQLELGRAGTAQMGLAADSITADDFAFVHLALEESSNNLVITLTWTNSQKPEGSHSYVLESHVRQSLWLSTEELRGWDGEIDNLGLSFLGAPGDTVIIKDFSVLPSSPTRQLKAIYCDLTGYAPWNSAAMNTYTGAFNSSSFYPIVLVVALLLLSVLAYGLLVFILRAKIQFNPVVVALIFFTCWIILDMFWQNRLLHQLVDTHRLFSGKNTEEKLAVGPDTKLYQFVSRVKPLLDPTDPRILVASSDAYSGMRTAYYLLPLNVYWSLHAPALPRYGALRKGDYIVLINPSPFEFDRKRNLVVAPKRRNLSAELIFSDSSGTVVRLN